ncbi:hypothetical protein SDC9_156669 [bioreactor metagenome]|uniref:Beta-lactamase-related domain-containing protein n=1 Tax=bioreactor metagenome TaxID=1076179 RepID=A0A645F676_9ZZZZ
MNHTGYNPKKDTRLLGMNSAVTEYNESCNGYIEGIVHDENARYQGGVSANAGVFSTVDDLIKFAVMLSNRGKYSNKIYLNKRTFELAITDHTPQKGDSRGLGFELYDGGLFPTGDLFSPLSYGHNGFTGTSLYVDRETGFFMIFLTNRVHFTRESSALYRLRRAVANSAISEYLRGM